jgi:hypothetical protein
MSPRPSRKLRPTSGLRRQKKGPGIVPGPISLQTCYPDHIRNFPQLTDNGSLWQFSRYSYFTFPTSMGKPRKIGNLNS